MFFFLGLLFCSLFLTCPKSFLVSLKMLDLGSMNLDLSFYVDWMSLLFFSVLCLMVSCVLKFSCVYMEKDCFKVRFTWMVLSFVFSMFCLIFLPHFFFLLIGWDGLGITSFLLVMYYLSDSSWSAGMKTYLMNRMGDSFFMLGMVLFLNKGCWETQGLWFNDFLVLLVVLGSFTKSAQFPFSSWLPAAMAAPTPVSALVHSSTLVTAGIYVMMRFCSIFPSWVFIMVGISGLWTLFSASLAACCEFDSKKMVAYSTLSQLGLMSVSISLNLPLVAFYHLITHAMFKALMFMCVGYLIKKSGHFQDLRNLNGVWSSSPVLGMTLMVSNLSLLGFPFLAAFYSKELMMENNMALSSWLYQYLLIISLALTSYYSLRLVFNMLKGCNYFSMPCGSDNNILMWSLVPLYMGSMSVGALLSTNFFSLCSVYPSHFMKGFVFTMMLSGVILSWYDVKMKKNSLMWFMSSMSFLVPFNSSFWKKKFSNVGSSYFYLLDQGIFSSLIKSLDKSLVISGNWLKSSSSYFLFPNVKYYMISIMGMSMFMGLMI